MMKDFGFIIPESRHIDLDKTDSRLNNFVLQNEPSYALCISCGGCTATCTASPLAFSLRKMNISLHRGELDYVTKQIDKCMMCGKCILVCPRGVQTRNVLLRIKQGIVKLKNNEF